VPAGVLAVFALGLVQRQDLDKLAGIQLRWGPFRQLRDTLVGAAGQVASVVAPGRSR